MSYNIIYPEKHIPCIGGPLDGLPMSASDEDELAFTVETIKKSRHRHLYRKGIRPGFFYDVECDVDTVTCWKYDGVVNWDWKDM